MQNRPWPLLQLLHCYTMRLPAAALILLLASPAANAETIAGRASVIDAITLEINGDRFQTRRGMRSAAASPVRSLVSLSRRQRSVGGNFDARRTLRSRPMRHPYVVASLGAARVSFPPGCPRRGTLPLDQSPASS